MANLTITATAVALIESPREPRTYPAGGTVTAGGAVYLDSSGFVVAGYDSAGVTLQKWIGVAVNSATTNLPVTVAEAGSKVDLGSALGSLAYGAPVYVATTAGILADATGSAGAAIGYVRPAHGAASAGVLVADKILQVASGLIG